MDSTGEDCTYAVMTSGKPDLVMLTFAPLPDATYASFESKVNDNVPPQATVTALPGYGQAAFTVTGESLGNNAVFVLENDVFLAITTAAPLSGAEALAQQILDPSSFAAEPDLQPTHQPSFDINSATAWKAACGIPAARMSALLKGSGVDPITETVMGSTNDECAYQGTDPNKINTFGVSVEELGDPAGYGFATDLHHTWHGADPASAYMDACAQDKAGTGNFDAVCDPTIGKGLVIERGRTDAVLFLPGKYFYALTFYSLGGNDTLTPYFKAVAKRLAALPAIK